MSDDFASLSLSLCSNQLLFGSLEGIAPLAVAAFFGDHALIRFLLEARACPSIPNARGDLRITIAIAQGHEAVADEPLNFYRVCVVTIC